MPASVHPLRTKNDDHALRALLVMMPHVDNKASMLTHSCSVGTALAIECRCHSPHADDPMAPVIPCVVIRHCEVDGHAVQGRKPSLPVA